MIPLRHQARRMIQGLKENQRYRQYLQLQRLVLSQEPTTIGWNLTCQGKTDGGGAQWHACFSVLALTRSFHLAYHHTPFRAIEHGCLQDVAWLQAWNRLFDLQAIGIPLVSSEATTLLCSDPLQVLHLCRSRTRPPEQLLQLEHAHAFTNLHPDRLAALIPLLRQAYTPSPQLPAPPLPPQRSLVVHVRRGDVQAHGPHRQRFTSAELIASRCRRLLALHPQLSEVLLLSASADADLVLLCEQEGYHLDASHDVFTHFHWMSQAGGLVMAKSSLSYLAAMLNPNLVFYERFEHPPLPGWIRLRAMGPARLR